MHENKKQKLASKDIFYERVRSNALLAFIIMIVSLSIGILGYKNTVPEFDWYDSLLNASMILSAMGPVVDSNIVLTNSAKVFASFYALFSGILFITNIGIILAPAIHRLYHALHIEEN